LPLTRFFFDEMRRFTALC